MVIVNALRCPVCSRFSVLKLLSKVALAHHRIMDSHHQFVIATNSPDSNPAYHLGYLPYNFVCRPSSYTYLASHSRIYITTAVCKQYFVVAFSCIHLFPLLNAKIDVLRCV